MSNARAFDVVTRRLFDVTDFAPAREGGNWRCPAHADDSPSLSVTNGNGKVVLHCHAGCGHEEVVRALGLTIADLFDAPSERSGRHSDIAATYDYVDEAGALLFQVVRFTPKDFRQRRPDGHGGWTWKLGDTRRVLYRLPEALAGVAEGRRIFVTEGEKDADALTRVGEVATTNPGGAGKWRAEYAEALRGADVVVVADRDGPGIAHARQVEASLQGVAAKVAVVEPAAGKDVADHLAAGHSSDDFLLLEEELEPASSPENTALPIAPIAEVAARVDAAPSPGWLFSPVWPGDAYGVMAAEDKAGKTFAILDAVISVASGTAWMGQFPCLEPGPVLVFLGEGGERKMIRRLRAIAAARGLVGEDLPIRLCFRVPRLTSEDHIALIADELAAHPARLSVIDPLYLAARGARGSDLYEMGAHLERVQQVTQVAGTALIVVTHWNKTGEGRGAKRITGVGPGAWGRVLATAAVEHRQTDPVTKATAVTLAWEFVGDEIPETELRIRRRVWADDPMTSALHCTTSSRCSRTVPQLPVREATTCAQRRAVCWPCSRRRQPPSRDARSAMPWQSTRPGFRSRLAPSRPL